MAKILQQSVQPSQLRPGTGVKLGGAAVEGSRGSLISLFYTIAQRGAGQTVLPTAARFPKLHSAGALALLLAAASSAAGETYRRAELPPAFVARHFR
jgi:hypothetical protein